MSDADYQGLYEKMVLIRTLETKFWDLAKEFGEVSDLHLNRGQEAVSVGVCAALGPDNYMVTHHRTIAHYLAKGGELQPLVDEILGRATGICGGRSNEMHIMNPAIGYLFSFQLVGTAMPVSVGCQWASQYVKREDKITAVFLGDASTSNAQFVEGLNAAAIRRVKLLVIIEDNGRAGNIIPKYYFPDNAGIKERFAAFGVETQRIDGNRIDEVVKASELAIEKVKSTSRPFGLICDTTRLTPHKVGQGDARTPEEIAEASKRDPIPYTEKLLGLTEAQIAEIKEEATRKVNEAIDKAHAAPWPTPDKVLLDNYNS